MVPNLPDVPPVLDTTHGVMNLGGTRAANARAIADSWPKLLQFLDAAGS